MSPHVDSRWRRFVCGAVMGLVATVLAACSGGDEELLARSPVDPPPVDAYLADGGWDEAAAWIARENAAGRPVLVNVFASWCVPCRREIPLLLDSYDSNPDVAFLGVAHLDQRDNAHRFVEEMDVRFPTIYDVAGDFAMTLGARGMPTTVVFDTEGRIAALRTGELTATSLQELLDAVT